MTILIVWTVLSTVGVGFALHETYRASQSVKSVRNKFNGRRIMARSLLFKSLVLSLIFMDFAIIGGVSSYISFAGYALETQEAIRQAFVRPGVVLGLSGMVVLVVESSVTRILLDREVESALDSEELAAVVEDTNRRVRHQESLQKAELLDRDQGEVHRHKDLEEAHKRAQDAEDRADRAEEREQERYDQG